MASMSSDKGKVLIAAELDPRIHKYYLLFALAIPPLWPLLLLAFTFFLPIVLMYVRRYFDYHSLKLLEDRVEFRSGVFNRHEADIPLERITDVVVAQGPLSRRFGFHGITVETAGQTRMQGTAKLHGVLNAHAFREMVLKQRNSVKGQVPSAPAASAGAAAGDGQVLQEIRDLLRKIEKNTSGKG